MLFETSEKLQALGADITAKEIVQQPKLWIDTLGIYHDNQEQLTEFLDRARALGGEQKTRVIFCGAGTSQYVSDTVVPHLRKYGDTETFSFEGVATTDIVAAPFEYLVPSTPTVVVSFARSGNSPESLATVKLASQLLENVLFLNITCAPEGALATSSKEDMRALTLLIPGANDRGFAMTGSYSCMALLATLIFDTTDEEQKAEYVHAAARLGEAALAREDEIQALVDLDFSRITYLGSGALSGLARETQLKILELCAGKIATSFDSSMGYRHGPKSFVDENTLVFVYVSNDDYTRLYDLDILGEVAGDGIAKKVLAIQQEGAQNFEGPSFTLSTETVLPDAYAALPFVIFGQTVGILSSLKIKNRPDTPSANGTVNRVVKGVTIHELDN